jgi:hypothetical protein
VGGEADEADGEGGRLEAAADPVHGVHSRAPPG